MLWKKARHEAFAEVRTMLGFLDRFGRPHGVTMIEISKAQAVEILAAAKVNPEFMICVPWEVKGEKGKSDALKMTELMLIVVDVNHHSGHGEGNENLNCGNYSAPLRLGSAEKSCTERYDPSRKENACAKKSSSQNGIVRSEKRSS